MSDIIEKARKLRKQIEKNAQSLKSTMDVFEFSDLFPMWSENVSYKKGNLVNYNGELYKVLTTHTSQKDWTPENNLTLFEKLDSENKN